MSQKVTVLLVAVMATAIGVLGALLFMQPAAPVVASPAPSGLLSQSEMESMAANSYTFVREDGARCTILPNGEFDCECCKCEAAPYINATPVATMTFPVRVTQVYTVQLPCEEAATVPEDEEEEAFLIDEPAEDEEETDVVIPEPDDEDEGETVVVIPDEPKGEDEDEGNQDEPPQDEDEDEDPGQDDEQGDDEEPEKDKPKKDKGNNGHGNNDDGRDSSNPGKKKGDDPSAPDDDEGHGGGNNKNK